MPMLLRTLVLITMTAFPAGAAEKVAFFGITFLDASHLGAIKGRDPAETARTAMLDQLVRDRFAREGYDLVALDPVSGKLAGIANPAQCNRCDTRMAVELGADYSLVGEVHKVSNLILSMNLQLREADTGTLVKGLAVDIRSNTDESWRRGMQYILRYAFFGEGTE